MGTLVWLIFFCTQSAIDGFSSNPFEVSFFQCFQICIQLLATKVGVDVWTRPTTRLLWSLLWIRSRTWTWQVSKQNANQHFPVTSFEAFSTFILLPSDPTTYFVLRRGEICVRTATQIHTTWEHNQMRPERKTWWTCTIWHLNDVDNHCSVLRPLLRDVALHRCGHPLSWAIQATQPASEHFC